jgi:aspartate/methionine/tyrosine aminotransferase
MVRLISHGGNYVQGPVAAASILLWQDEGHVEANRALYRENLAIAAEIFAGYAGFHPIQAGFFLWLAVGDDEDFARRLWQEAGIKVLPGRYLGRSDSDPLTGQDLPNPGEGFIRIALVHPPSITRPALHRIAELIKG